MIFIVMGCSFALLYIFMIIMCLLEIRRIRRLLKELEGERNV